MVFLKIISFLVRLLPLRLALWKGSAWGMLAYWLFPSRRRIALANLKASFPDKDAKELKRIAKGVAKNMGRNAVEFLRMPMMDRAYIDRHIEWVGLENLDNALKLNRGVFILTAHIGNWDLLAAATALKSYGSAVRPKGVTADHTRLYSAKAEQPAYKVNLITKHLSVNALNDFWTEYRAKMNITQLYREGSLRQIITALKNNELMGFILDQHTHKSDGVQVDFFGRPAWTTPSLAVLSQRYNVPVVPGFIVRKSGADHRITFEPAINLPESDYKASDYATRATQIYVKALERFIRDYPDQWIWMHRRWKS